MKAKSANLKQNPFPVASPLENVLLQELILVAKNCYQRGWCYGTAGNFSLRGGGIIWQSTSALSKGDLKLGDFMPVDFATGQTILPLSRPASAEMPVHLAIYDQIAAAQCVVHAHPPAVCRKSLSGLSLTFIHQEMQKALTSGDHSEELRVDVLPNPTMEEMKHFRKNAAKVQHDAPVWVLAGHGVYAWGKTPLKALAHLEALEFLCEQIS